ncbi:myb proto-oncogene protein [Senna tora]|uniref:Myb proto-oncogene protein n=1 Tax=Senna tora TaxID=362788 RepID=A0A834T909_9FABA|nr:myb proto-oncogene protein [Senna tora]
MALLPSLAISSTPKFRVKPFLDQPCKLQSCSAIHIPHQTFSTRTCSIKVSMAEHNEPNEVKTQIKIMKEKLREALPVSIKEFPWNKAERKLLDRLISLARKALNWSLVLFFVFSSISDIVYTLSMNRELIIPFGLFVGCLVADFLKETSQELFHSPEENGLKQHVLGMYCFFVFLKMISACFGIQAQVFLLHVANGGLMQALWYWRSSREDVKNGEERKCSSGLEAS